MHLPIATRLVLIAALATPLSLPAQELSQSLRLEPGWNPVYLEVDPAESACSALNKIEFAETGPPAGPMRRLSRLRATQLQLDSIRTLNQHFCR